MITPNDGASVISLADRREVAEREDAPPPAVPDPVTTQDAQAIFDAIARANKERAARQAAARLAAAQRLASETKRNRRRPS